MEPNRVPGMLHSTRWIVPLLVMGLVTLGAVPTGDGAEPAGEVEGRYTFTAYRMDSEEPAFRGEYRVEREGPLLHESQVYRNLDGEPVTEIRSVFNTDSMEPVSYRSHSYLDRKTITAEMRDGRIHFTVLGEDGEELVSGERKWPRAAILWPNIPQVVKRNWQALQQGLRFRVWLYLVTEQTLVELDVRKVGTESFGGRPATTLELRPASWLLRAFADPVTMTLSDESPGLPFRFEGRSPVVDEEGEAMDLRIVMDLQPAAMQSDNGWWDALERVIDHV